MNKDYFGLEKVIDKTKIKYNEPMKKHTTMKVGGPCDVMVLPTTIDEIKLVIDYAKLNDIKWMVLGNGSNVIVRDEGIRGIVIKLTQNYSKIDVNGEYIIAYSGVSVPLVAYYAKKNCLSGFEFACGIPGTIGGAVKMNAGAYDGQMCDIIDSVDYLDEEGNVKTFSKDDLKFSYRHSIFSENKKLIVLAAKFKLVKSEYQEIEKKMNENNLARQTKQPLEYPSAGSVFRRPQGYFVGKLVSDSGLRGVMLGGAQVSEKHTGFIINRDNATAKDILDLIELVIKTVNEKFGVLLKTEVEIIGGEN
ncbi:MAG: UDP-N-acetylmuramate dehydrogenase [Clostridia bacterium]|nr:UDP-N-acetylmuramate dehydrogenase [Clostridia bacterium]